ncbi:vacuolar sorting protein VPS33/slp1 [Kappamyces sp. JEL0680]|nr:vacuolar sorting protein VPS33/slp1 [Kappamyces sp. JEL0680]
MSATSLKDLLRKRVMDDMIKAVQPAAKWKLLVVDSNSAKLLSTICKSHEILQENVTVIEDMSQKRQPFPNYEAIYFVTPTARTIDKIIADFKQDKPIYLAAHIFFTASLDDSLFDKIKKSGISKFIKGCKEMNIDFIDRRAHAQLTSLLNTLGDSPFIRFWDPAGNGNGIAGKLARMVQQEMKDLEARDDGFPVKSDYRKTILIIVDRTFDMMAPLLHEFTYQAMMNDLICGEKGRPTDLPGGIAHPGYFLPNPNYASLDESDAIWLLIRHWHFAEAVDHILSSFSKFLNENKAASAAVGANNNASGIDALKAMKDTLSALPQFQSLKTKYSTHISVCQECKSLFEKRNLDLVAAVQQDMATGETSDGKAIRNAMLDLIPVLDNKRTTPYDKLRSLMVYIIGMNGLQDMERRRLLETAKISPEDSQAITNLGLFDVTLSSGQDKKTNRDKRYTYWGSYKQERKKKKSKNEDSMPYDLSRYVPLVKKVIEDQIANSVPKDGMPWVEEPKPEDLGITSNTLKMFRFTSNGLVPPDPNYPHSLRTTRASWSGRTRAQKANNDDEKDKEKIDLRVNGSRIILFSLGGLTYSEIRAAYEVTRDTQREIYIGMPTRLLIVGSTFVYNPAQFIDVLKELHKVDLPALPTSPTATELPKDDPKEKKGVSVGGIFGKKK